MAVNPELYTKVYGEEGEATDMQEIEQVVPQSEQDVQRLLADLAAMGIQP